MPPAEASTPLVDVVVAHVRACADAPSPAGAIAVGPIETDDLAAAKARVAELEAELAKARRAVAFFTIAGNHDRERCC